jgi:hypothetical protein
LIFVGARICVTWIWWQTFAYRTWLTKFDTCILAKVPHLDLVTLGFFAGKICYLHLGSKNLLPGFGGKRLLPAFGGKRRQIPCCSF